MRRTASRRGPGEGSRPPRFATAGHTIFSVRDIWYGDARRIDADEMDKLRQEAEKAELAQAVAAIEFLKNKILASPSSAPHQVITSLRAALLDCHRDTVGN
jgi:hypothetical protein